MSKKTGPALIALGLGLLAMLGMGKARAKPVEDCDPGPFRFNPKDVQDAIKAALDDGMRNDMRIATHVARSMWAEHPDTGAPMVWPPPPSASEYQRCAWTLVLSQIDIYKKEHGIPPFPPCPDDTELQDGVCDPVGPDPVDISPWLNDDPTWPLPGTFYQVEGGDIFLGENPGDSHSIVYSTLLSAAYHAAKTVGGVSDDEARDFAQSVAFDEGKRLDYYTLILCSPWNDAVYGTYGYGDPIGPFDSPMNRAIRLLPIHADNFERISAGLAPWRNIQIGNAGTPGDGSGGPMDDNHKSFELLWLPAINLEVLWSSNGEAITTEGMTWEDGSNMLMPPPVVAVLGAENVPPGTWGCTGLELIPTEEI